MAARINIVSFCLFLCLFHHAISLCPYQCDCREEPSSCPAGVSLVMDGCNCCKVCAKQLAQQCNGDDAICDVHRNLFCDHSASRSGDIGICRARTGRPCWHGNVRISSGSMFEPSCKTRCWCMDGAIGCIPLCPHETQLPRPDRCPNARLQPVTGQCCDQWGCDTSSGDITILPLNNFWDEYVDVKSGDAPSENLLPEVGNGVRDGVIYEDDVGENADDLLDYQMTQTMNFNPELNLEESWHQNNFLPGDIFVHRHAAKVALERRRNCQAKSSQWSPCSKNCGLGVSARVSNNNGRCELARETRLCEFKPCNDLRYLPKKGRHCLRQKRAKKRMSVKYAGCMSLKKIRPRFCGSCHGDGRCCTPKTTRTAHIRFRCEDGAIFSKKIMVIRSCHCHKNCVAPTPTSTVVRYSLFDDMHVARDR